MKLKPTAKQEEEFRQLFFQCAGAWNWAVRKIMLDARDGRFHTPFGLNTILGGHGPKCGINQQTLQQIAKEAHASWQACWRGGKGRPRLKGKRNRLSSVPLVQGVRFKPARHVHIPSLGRVRYRHRGLLPEGPIKQARLIRKARGWYLTLFIDAAPRPISPSGCATVGVDLGYARLATLSSGEIIEHPKELARLEPQLAREQRGGSKGRAARLQQRIATARRKRNHSVSRDLVSRFSVIYISKDNLRGLQRTFGKSVLSAGHGQLRTMIQAKSRQAGRVCVEVDSRNSTRRCSSCGGLSGPAGFAGLKVRQWQCGACGALHDRDQNAAVNAVIAGAVLAL